MERVVQFLKEAETYYLATVEGDQPRVRPFGTVHIFEGKLVLPCRSDRFIFSGQDAALRPFIVEQKVGVSGDILPAVSQQRVGRCFFGLPMVKKRKDRSGRRGINPIQNGMVQLCTGFEALDGALRLAFFV